MRHVHHAEPADHGVKRGIRQIEPLTVHHPGVHLTQTAPVRLLLCERHYPLGQIGGEHIAIGPDPLGGTDRRLPGSGGDVEDALTGPDPGAIEHQARHLSVPAIQHRVPAPPRGAIPVPLRTLRALVLRSIERLQPGHLSPVTHYWPCSLV